VTTTLPETRRKPASNAAVWPALRRKNTSLTCFFSAAIARRISRVPSRLASSTHKIS
jgi:hypothetical protein